MDEIESGNAAPATSEAVGAIARRRVRALIAVATGALVVVGVTALLAGCHSGSSDHAGAGTTDTTGGTGGRSGTQSGGGGTTVKSDGTGPTDSTSRTTGPKNTGSFSTGPGATTVPRHTDVPTVPRRKPGTTVKIPQGIQPPNSTPSPTIAPTLTLAYTTAYQNECRHIWATTADADGLLYDADWVEQGGYPVSVCFKQENPLFAGTYATPDDARQGGIDDADSDMSDWTLGGTLTNTSRSKNWPA